MEKLTVQEAVRPVRVPCMNIAGMTGGVYVTVHAQECDPEAEKNRQNMRDPMFKGNCLVRSMIRYYVREHFIESSRVVVNPTSNQVSVIFNEGKEDEATAFVLAGKVSFEPNTREGVERAIRGEKVIFSDYMAVVNIVNELNEHEIAIHKAIYDKLGKHIQSTLNTSHENIRKAKAYMHELEESTPKVVPGDDNVAPSITVEPANA